MNSPSTSGYSSSIPEAKCVVLGNASVGKTSIMSRFVSDNFDERIASTTGPQFDKKTIYVNSYKMRLKLWDTAGYERFRSLCQMCYRDAGIIVFVFDVTQPYSLADLRFWVELVDLNSDPRAIRAVVANKIDLERAIPQEDGKQFAADNHMSYFECSAKDGSGVEKIFYYLAVRKLGPSVNNSFATETEPSKVDHYEPPKKKTCC